MAYKFCVLHLSHFFELVFKHNVVKISPLLIYKIPSKKITVDSHTITLDEAVIILENNGCQFSHDFKTNLNWFKQLRNSIAHHKFDMSISKLNDVIGRLIKSFDSVQEVLGRLDFSPDINIEQLKLFFDLSDSYEQKLNALVNYVADLNVVAQGVS